MGFTDRLKHAWDAFRNRDPTSYDYGLSYSYRPDRARFTRGNDRSILTSVLNRIAMDAAAIDIQHVRLDKNGRYKETIDSGLNQCLNVEANIDQSGRAFRQDIFASLLDEGCVAIVPVETSVDPKRGSYRIDSMRVGKVIEWFPEHVRVRLYNQKVGKHEEIVLPKKIVALPENPFYAVMNEPNSTAQRLMRKLSLLDVVDEHNCSGKLDLIIQLPYVVKTDLHRRQADRRRKDVEDQLANSKYGVAYIDGTERVTQLNRPIENNLMKQIEYLQNLFYSQLGMTATVMDGTADEKTMLNYNNRAIEPIISAVVDEMKRKFLTKTARSQRQSIVFFRDPFRLVPVNDLAEIADKMTRNEIMTSNEIRQVIGMKPSEDPNADTLRNKNLSVSNEELVPFNNGEINDEEEGEIQNGYE